MATALRRRHPEAIDAVEATEWRTIFITFAEDSAALAQLLMTCTEFLDDQKQRTDEIERRLNDGR